MFDILDLDAIEYAFDQDDLDAILHELLPSNLDD